SKQLTLTLRTLCPSQTGIPFSFMAPVYRREIIGKPSLEYSRLIRATYKISELFLPTSVQLMPFDRKYCEVLLISFLLDPEFWVFVCPRLSFNCIESGLVLLIHPYELGVELLTTFELDELGVVFVPALPVYGFTFPTVLQLLLKLPSGLERI